MSVAPRIIEVSKVNNPFSIGDMVRANRKSNREYGITNQENLCEGKIIEIDEDKIRLKITSSKQGYRIGESFRVRHEFFDLIPILSGDELYLNSLLKQGEN